MCFYVCVRVCACVCAHVQCAYIVMCSMLSFVADVYAVFDMYKIYLPSDGSSDEFDV